MPKLAFLIIRFMKNYKTVFDNEIVCMCINKNNKAESLHSYFNTHCTLLYKIQHLCIIQKKNTHIISFDHESERFFQNKSFFSDRCTEIGFLNVKYLCLGFLSKHSNKRKKNISLSMKES